MTLFNNQLSNLETNLASKINEEEAVVENSTNLISVKINEIKAVNLEENNSVDQYSSNDNEILLEDKIITEPNETSMNKETNNMHLSEFEESNLILEGINNVKEPHKNYNNEPHLLSLFSSSNQLSSSRDNTVPNSFNLSENPLNTIDNGLIIQNMANIDLSPNNNADISFDSGIIETKYNSSLDLEKASQSSISEESTSDDSCESLSSEPKMSSDIFEVSAPLHEVEKHKADILHLQKIIDELRENQARLEIEASHTSCQSQLAQQRREIDLFKQEHELDVRTQATLKLEIETLKKQYENANKEKEASVMRYATSEMEVIKQRSEKENIDKKYKEVLKEKEGLTTKLKNVMIEKARINLLLDNKCSELYNAQKDVEKLKDDLNSRDIKIKWTQNKLKTEIESHKECQAQVEKLSSMIQESKDEVEKAKKDAEISIKQFQFSQENKAYVLDQQLKEHQAQLILERHNLEDKEVLLKQLTTEVDNLQAKQLLYLDENNALKLKVSSLEKEKQENESTISRLKDNTEKDSEKVSELQEKVSILETLQLQLQQEKEKVRELQTEVSQLKTNNEDLLSDMESCRVREAEMLEFTQKVTAKNVRLQSEYSCIEAKVRQLEFAEEPLQRQIDELTKKIESLQKELSKERSDRGEEKKVVARHLAEKTARVETLMKEVEDLKGENQVMKHKQATSLRELNREVREYRRKLEQLETGGSSGSDSVCQVSRASSCNSLHETSPPSTAVIFSGPSPAPLEPDKQAMVDRILRLQRENVRLREKIDFLEEHSKQLVSEMQKKTRVLQSYMLREEAGTLSSGGMDFHKLNIGWAKLKTKAEMARHGGIMASVYNSKSSDDTMTLDLSLQINRKLQAVLEDTLLKNITLKENIDTLGDEIRRLSKKS